LDRSARFLNFSSDSLRASSVFPCCLSDLFSSATCRRRAASSLKNCSLVSRCSSLYLFIFLVILIAGGISDIAQVQDHGSFHFCSARLIIKLPSHCKIFPGSFYQSLHIKSNQEWLRWEWRLMVTSCQMSEAEIQYRFQLPVLLIMRCLDRDLQSVGNNATRDYF